MAGTSEQFININALPAVAIQRLEILKDGASALYGSDAIAGVANFITRSEFRGIELTGAARDMDGGEHNNWEAGVIAGFGGDRLDLVASFGYEYRTRIAKRTGRYIPSRTHRAAHIRSGAIRSRSGRWPHRCLSPTLIARRSGDKSTPQILFLFASFAISIS